MISGFHSVLHDAVSFESDETERLVNSGRFIHWAVNCFNFAKLREIASQSFVSCIGFDSTDKHLAISSFSFLGVNLFTVETVVGDSDDTVDGGLVFEQDETETSTLIGHWIHLNRHIFNHAKPFEVCLERFSCGLLGQATNEHLSLVADLCTVNQFTSMAMFLSVTVGRKPTVGVLTEVGHDRSSC